MLRRQAGQHGGHQRRHHHAEPRALHEQQRHHPRHDMRVPRPAGHVGALQRMPRREHEGAERDRGRAAEAAGDAGAGHRGREEADGQRREDDARVERAQPHPLLQVQREHEVERGVAHIEGQRGEQPGHEAAVGEQHRRHQRRTAACRKAALLPREEAPQRHGGGQAQPAPQRPALLAPFDQRQHHGHRTGRDQRHAGEVEPAVAPALRQRRHHARREQERQQADGHVDEKAAAPAEARKVGMDQRAAHQLPQRGRQAQREAVGREGARPVFARVGQADHREHLRLQQRAGQALQQARGHEQPGVRRHAAGGRGEREQQQAEHEHAAPAEQVAQPPARDQARGGGQAVARHHQLQRARAGLQVVLHRWQRDVDDEEIEHHQEGAAEHDPQAQPARCGGRDRWGRRNGRVRRGHGPHCRHRPASRQ
ncbi:hypothetical protein D3C87_775610 [compost metagenome]